MLLLSAYIYFFNIYGLIHDAIGSLDYIALNDRIINE
jgi:hypothetical protein